jgi:hypothetical protein
MISVGEGPTVTNISARRRGILDTDFEAWILKRRRPAPNVIAAKACTRRRP